MINLHDMPKARAIPKEIQELRAKTVPNTAGAIPTSDTLSLPFDKKRDLLVDRGLYGHSPRLAR